MKQSVLERADEVRPRPVRRRHAWPVVGLVVLLAAGTASGAYAAGLVPKDLFSAPAPVATDTPAPSPAVSTPAPLPSPSSAAPAPEPTPTPTPSKVFTLDDPATWTISSTEVGPVALGAPYDGEVDDLTSAYTTGNENCPNPDVSFWDRKGSITLIVVKEGGVVSGVSLGLVAPSDPAYLKTSPTTATGAGIGTTLEQLKADYPQLTRIGTYGPGPSSEVFSLWSVKAGANSITFQFDGSGTRVGLVWVGANPKPPYEFCG